MPDGDQQRQTLANIPHIIHHGADWFAIGTAAYRNTSF
jgi:NADH:ubiquinone oxidoreductase subunit F (NADH-binding)